MVWDDMPVRPDRLLFLELLTTLLMNAELRRLTGLSELPMKAALAGLAANMG